MSKKATLELGDLTFELKYTMRRARMLAEASGVDVLNDQDGFNAFLRASDGSGATLTLYCLAGGLAKTGVTLEDFEDAITVPDDLFRIEEALNAVFRRDLPKPEEGDAPNASGPKGGKRAKE